VGPWFERLEARDPRECSAEGIRSICKEQRGQLFWVIDPDSRDVHAAFATECRIGANGSEYLNVLGLAGERMSLWLEAVMDALDVQAERYGCPGDINITGRKGWVRALRKRYRPARTILERIKD
jgi:hypothetical protein